MQVYFAPLESITGYVFRNVYETYYGGIDRYFTPFITATDSRRLRNKEMRDILPDNNSVGCLIPQIMSNRAEEFLRVADQMAELGYDTVNLNLGCPARTVVSKGKGSGFLARTVALDRFLREIYEKCPLKISIKTRLGVDDPEEFLEIIDIYNQYPVEELIIHPRVQKDYYKNTPNLDMFAEAVKRCRMPLCYNGDICSVEDYERIHTRFPEVSRIMIGRGLLAHPELALAIKGEPVTGDITRIGKYADAVCRAYCEAYGPGQPVLFKMKELWGFLADSMPDGRKLRKRIHKTQRLDGYQRLMQEVFHHLPEQPTGQHQRTAHHHRRGGGDELFRFQFRKPLLHPGSKLFCPAGRHLGVEPGVGLACGFLLLQVCRPVVPVLNFCGQAFFHGFGGLIQQLLLPGFHLGKMLGQ